MMTLVLLSLLASEECPDKVTARLDVAYLVDCASKGFEGEICIDAGEEYTDIIRCASQHRIKVPKSVR